MGINLPCADAIHHLFVNEQLPNKRVLSLGFPDIVVSGKELKERLNLPNLATLPPEDDRTKVIAKYHGIEKDDIPCTNSLFHELGATTFISIDITKEKRDNEIHLDLNYPLPIPTPEPLLEPFGVILDLGTLEHCFNAPQALETMQQLIAPGGFIIHWNPFYMPNHGFYSFNPTFYADWYKSRGFTLKSVSVWGGKRQVFTNLTDRFKFDTGGEEFSNLVIVQAPKEFVPPTSNYPCQTKYVKMGLL